MAGVFSHWPRIGVTLIPLLLGLLHAINWLPLTIVNRLDDIIYDTRMRATMPRTLDDRIVIVDIDEKSLAEIGRWPWSRNKVAALTDQLFDNYKIALMGIDVVFAEADNSSGLKQLQHLAQTEFRAQAEFVARVDQLKATLDYDQQFASALENRPVVMGYYFTSDRDGRSSGALPAPVMRHEALMGRNIRITQWNGYGSNLDLLARSAPKAGFFNSLPNEGDGLVRSLPMLGEYQSQYYESLSLAMFRLLTGNPAVEPGFPQESLVSRTYGLLASIQLKLDGRTLAIPVNELVAALVPYRGPGGPRGGSFTYMSAADVLTGKIPAAALKDRIVLLGTTAPGLQDLRATPVGDAYPGVETHANLISGLLDGKVLVSPDYQLGFEVFMLLASGLLLAIGLPLLSAPRALLLSAVVMGALVGLNFWLYLGHGLVLPLASMLLATFAAFALNMSYGYFVESRSKRALAHLFGSYVAPELVVEMVKNPDSYSMKAVNKELTVMFCDMRGFTKMSESMEPLQLQQLLNSIFSQLTVIIRANRGTIDKYMGDCVMAFWGAPVDMPDHAQLAVKTAIEMLTAIKQINVDHRIRGLPEIGIGIGLNTGTMCVGDMGSVTRRSYTVIGDAVNLGSRLEGLSKTYGVEIVANGTTRKLAGDFTWQELDTTRVRGKQKSSHLFTPVLQEASENADLATELRAWNQFLAAYRSQDWDKCDVLLLNLQRLNPLKPLYRLYADRLSAVRRGSPDPQWDDVTSF
jgi:adenylate cyclase